MTAKERAWQITAIWGDGTNDVLQNLIVHHILVVGREAVAEERERCAQVAESESSCFCVEEYLARNKHASDCLWKEGQEIATAIRKG